LWRTPRPKLGCGAKESEKGDNCITSFIIRQIHLCDRIEKMGASRSTRFEKSMKIKGRDRLGGITIEGCNITIDVRIMYQDTE
jgi:hypothetical protein